jgi:PAS domain S-box-containing protein
MTNNIIPEKINILYIEDDEEVCKLVQSLLDKYSNYTEFNITLKNNLQSGIEYLKTHCFSTNNSEVDLILLDLVLPNSKGVSTFKEVKKVCKFLPIVVISGYEDIACECVRLGAQDYLVKPSLTGGLLIRSIKYAIERTRMENIYKDIIKTSPLGYHVFTLENDDIIFSDFNPAANDILRVDNAEYLDMEIREAFPNISDDVYNSYKKTLIDGTPIINKITEYEDDKIHYGFYRINAHKTAAKNLAVTFEDITEQVYMERSLKESERKYRELVEVTGAGIYEIDFTTMKFTYVNDVICQQSGYSREEMLNMGPSNFLKKEGMIKFLNRIKSLKKGEYITEATEYEVIKKDGSSLWIMITAMFEEDPISEQIIGANVVAIDITAQKNIELALKQKEKEVYTTLENKIHRWKEEILERNIETEEKLDVINNEILSMSSSSASEGSL